MYQKCVLNVGSIDYNHVNGFLKCSNDFKNILNYLIPWHIDYTQACIIPITMIMISGVNTYQIAKYCSNNYFKHWIE